MPQEDDKTPPIEDLQKLLEAAKPELLAIDPQQHVRRVVTRRRVVELSDILLMSWAALNDSLDQELSPERAELRKTQLARIDGRAWVFYAADLIAEDLDTSTNKAERVALAELVREHDTKLMLWAIPCFGDNPSLAATVRDISRGTGRRDDAEDVLRLVRLYRDNWEVANARQKEISQQYLDQAAADAGKQLAILRNQNDNPARKLADSAYLLWRNDYNDLMQLGRYLTWTESDSTQRFPGIHEPAKGGAGVEPALEPEANTDEVELGVEEELASPVDN